MSYVIPYEFLYKHTWPEPVAVRIS